MKEPRSTLPRIEVASVEAVAKRLAALKKQSPPPRARTARQALEQHWYPLLAELIEAGWSYADLAREVSGAGVSIKGETLRAYFRDAVRKKNPVGEVSNEASATRRNRVRPPEAAHGSRMAATRPAVPATNGRPQPARPREEDV